MTIQELRVFILAVSGLCAVMGSPSSAQEKPNNVPRGARTPFTYLFDTRAPSPTRLPAQALAKRTGWTAVPEDNLSHAFTGDAVFLNDRLAVVLRRRGPGAEIYSRTAGGMKHRVLLAAFAAEGDRTTGLSAVKIIKNSPAAVILDAAFKTEAGRGVSVRFRLTTGVMFLEARPGRGVSKLFIRNNARYVVVPDFFGDDMVFGAEGFDASRIGLPTENFFLGLIDGGKAIVMCVWQSNEQNAEVIFADDGRERVIRGCDVECMKGKGIWVALLESPDVWHSRIIADKEGQTDIVLDWKPPFPAKWRCSLVRADGVAESRSFTDSRESKHPAAEVDKPMSRCWFHSNRAFVRIPRFQQIGEPRHVAKRRPRLLIVYPIDRSRSTPLNVFCPIDIVRNTLGVGPCQYILKMEGLGSEGQHTPDEVTRWVEKQFKRNRAKRASIAIKERLGQMTRHVKSVQARIRQYHDFARRLRRLCVNQERNKNTRDAARKLLGIAEEMERSITMRRQTVKTDQFAKQLAEAIIALIGKENSLSECRRLASQIRSLGAAQDKTLSRCRMALRRLKQQCRMIAAENPRAADFAQKVQRQVEQMLRKK